MMLCFLLLISLLATGHTWLLTSTHTKVIPRLTDDVTLNCFYEGPETDYQTTEDEIITRIRLLKMDDAKSWTDLAEIRSRNNASLVQLATPNLNLPGPLASGYLGNATESYLSLTWSTASADTAGSYRCEVDGVAVENGTHVHVATGTVRLTHANDVTTQELLDLVLQMKEKSNQLSRELRSLKEESSSQNSQIRSDVKSQFRDWSETMSQKFVSLENESSTRHVDLLTEMDVKLYDLSKIVSQKMTFFEEESSSRHQELITEMDAQIGNWSKIMSLEMDSLREENWAKHYEVTVDMKAEVRNLSQIMLRDMNSLQEECLTQRDKLVNDMDGRVRNWSNIMSKEMDSFEEGSYNMTQHQRLTADTNTQASNNLPNINPEDVINSFKNECLTQHDKLATDLNAQVKNWSKIMSKEMDSLKEENLARYYDLRTGLKDQIRSDIFKNYLELRHWPTGPHYSLLATNEGCPDSVGTKFKRGFSRYTTKTRYWPQHNFESAGNMTRDVFQRYTDRRNALKLHYCVADQSERRVDLSWPSGSYCISADSYCPAGFEAGWAYVYLESYVTISGGNFAGTMDHGSNYIQFNFCCRHDKGHETPILLPNTKPFYLYRYRGKCQRVQGLDVQEQSFTLAKDWRQTSYAEYGYPDISFYHDFTLHLCYYHKERDGTV